jgi:DNA-binding transcriptional MerR regulator
LPAAERRGGQRVYGRDALERLELLRAGQSLGFSLEEVATILRSVGEPGVTARWKALAGKKIAELDQTIRAARAIKRLLEEGLACGCVDGRDCLRELQARSVTRPSGGKKAPRPRATK